ncbi:hypothetical protein NM208_g3259 [Fusarium decemcellulare]|uniref:Uncharacterized protein n=2 Tax=Fusarium decemcellulare TaxID=57161 RepID=A0ACC1SLN2_9HYPO|nr:hypothetical protein NM208_g4139 [Fusarium decemcellulare]KAJ3544036.1 hypothetical protein NM208_g3259 [Fusarium decemcellulare]
MPNLRANIWVGLGIPWFAALVSLSLRICVRRMTNVSWWFDDYFSVAAFAFATGYSGIMVEWTLHTYLGVYLPDDLPLDEREAILEQSRFLSFFNSLCYAASIACSKLAILCLYWRLFKTSHIRYPILFLIGVVGVWIILRTFMLTFRCLPVQSLWDYKIKNKVCHLDSEQFFLATITTHFVLDIIILVLPLIEVFQLRMRSGQKIAVAALFLLGIIVCVASAFVLAILVTPSSHVDQPTYDYAMFCVWGSVEVNIAIVSACFPLLRPIFSYIFPKGVLSSYAKNSYPITGSDYHVSRSRANVKVPTFARSTQVNDDDGSSSTHQLADLSHGKSFDFIDQHDLDGVHTVVSSEPPIHRSNERQTPGIFISNDTIVEVEFGSRA